MPLAQQNQGRNRTRIDKKKSPDRKNERGLIKDTIKEILDPIGFPHVLYCVCLAPDDGSSEGETGVASNNYF